MSRRNDVARDFAAMFDRRSHVESPIESMYAAVQGTTAELETGGPSL